MGSQPKGSTSANVIRRKAKVNQFVRSSPLRGRCKCRPLRRIGVVVRSARFMEVRGPQPARVYSPGELQFIMTSTYHRMPLFLSDRFRGCFVQRLEKVRQQLHFLLVGWVLMPEHFHVLSSPSPPQPLP